MSKDDLRVIKTLEAIEYSLLKNLKEYSLSKITVDTLCKEARINRSTFYKYYSDKYDLLNKYTEDVLNEFKNCMDASFVKASPETINEKKYSNNFQQIITFLTTNKDKYMTLWNADMDRNIYVEMIDIIQENILTQMQEKISDNPEKEMYATLFSRIFPTNLMMSVKWWFDHQHNITINDFTKLMDYNMRVGIFQTFKEYV